MTTPTSKKLSRRDAIKLLGAATGAAMLANLPSKWKTPELASGVLPAHAQTSQIQILHSLTCAENFTSTDGTPPFDNPITSSVSIAPPTSGIPMNFSVVVNGFTLNSSANGTVNTVNGVASTNINWSGGFQTTNTIQVTWSFANASDALPNTDPCTQVLTLRLPA